MKNYLLNLFTAIFCSIVFANIELSLNNYSESNGTADIYYNSATEIGGFQISLSGAELVGGSGGNAGLNGFTISSSPGILLGFSFSGSTVSPGNGVLATVSFSPLDDQICLINPIVSDGGGNQLDVTLVNECVGDLPPLEGCLDPLACNYDPNAEIAGNCTYPENNLDCNGNCLTDSDCNGTCGGNAVVDACGVCGGDATDPDACGVPVYYSSSQDLGGFQFSVSGVTVVGASGGAAEETGFTVSTGGSTVLGFNLNGLSIPAGNGLLTFLETENGLTEGCLSDVIISSSNAEDLEYELESCNTIIIEGGFLEPVAGCTDADACNYNPLANTDSGNCEYPEDGFNCSGDCVVGVDCNGVCGGSGVEDCAGECNGDAVVDECGECDGQGPVVCSNGIETCDFTECPIELQFFTDLPEQTGVTNLVVISNDLGLEAGDEIGLFDANGVINSGDCSSQTGEILVGAGVYNGEQLEIVASGSLDFCDISGGTQMPGFINGNTIQIKIWSNQLNYVYSPNQLQFSIGDGNWGNSLTFISLLDGYIYGCTNPDAANYNENAEFDDSTCYFNTTLELTINPNYVNNVSYNLWHHDMDPSIFFGDYESIVVSDYHSNYFIPDLNVNSFENNGVNYNDGYIYFHNHPESIDLQIEGYTFSNPPNITLYPNVLNNVAYHLSHSSSVVEHFSNVPVLLIADDLGNFYVPSLDINTIDSNGGMIPGKGYYVFIHGDNEVSFDYDFNAPLLAKSNPEYLDELYYFDPVETGISIPIKVNFDVNFELSNYTEFGLFIDNNIAGNFKITNFDHNYESKIWLDNNSYSMQDIFNETLIGSLLSNIKIRAKLKDSDQVVNIDFSLNKNTRFPIIEVGKDNGNRDIFENISYNISDAYPNPFNPKTNIDYSIMEDGEVKITIFDINGNMVLEKPNTFLQAGSYKFTWDAGDMPSGIYFLAININDNILSSKLILMK